MKQTITLSGSSADLKVYKAAMKCAANRTLLSYEGSKFPVIFAGKIGGERTLVLLVEKEVETTQKRSKK